MYSFLVVSNDNSVCNFFKKNLDGDYIVYAARTPDEALQIFLDRDIDVTFLDILLSDDGANKLLETLRQANQDPMIVTLIPESQPTLSEEAIKLGAYEFLEKPFKKETIQLVAKRALEKQELKRELGFIQSQIKSLKPEDTRSSELTFNKQPTVSNLHLAYKEVFQKFSKALTQVYDLGKLADSIVDAIADIFKVGKIVFMLVNKHEGLSRPYRCLGFDEVTARSIFFTNNQGIILWLSKNHQILNKDVIDREITTNKLTMREVINVQKEINLLQAQLCIPIFANGNLSCVIALGNKITGKVFFDEDIELLSMLAGYIGMAVENAFLYQEVNLRKIHNENVLENIPYGIIAINTAYKINTFNRSASKMLNISSHDVLGKDVKYIGSLFADFLLRTLKEKKTYKMKEVTHPVTQATYDVSTSLLLDSYTEIGAIMIFSDLSEVVKLETKIKELEKLVIGYLGNSENAIPHDVTQAVTDLSKDWISERQRLSLKQDS
ncbi:MAG: response regulator [Candidatus Jettenia sp.]|uniref:Two-component sensor kinase n=1 Tax=Candidatus Jettenia caeni TaxID=247490 RepID=I3IIJ4_9BACT|nr:response regulator [Candidatus Jettenia sp. AMX1]MBC6928224.1 response regulator [Candidatus Jettenia sp.]WKZ16858.1 MAG: response regulator [Candidatus Jettenia caeni]KAA0250013.1 MAG: response regulator [Candidatus Jettenia sp. AMX1]MCE7880495.1 response regulator [Candidatus Jettenia sp. AMX1]MCQ3926303.1 response regulator [Candidatus Jettenia sp.]